MRPSTKPVITMLLASLAVVGCERSELTYIAHAAGGYNGQTYTNSINALEANAVYFEFFEIDLDWTSDNHLVCVHSWEDTDLRPTLETFMESLADSAEPRPCTMESLANWLADNPNKKLITDIKSMNLKGLEHIAERFGNIQHQIVPQIYSPSEYGAAKALGYEKIIWTLYRYPANDLQIVSEASKLDLFALALPHHRAQRNLIAELAKRGLSTLVHTINDPEVAKILKENGVAGIYTDWLKPEKESVCSKVNAEND